FDDRLGAPGFVEAVRLLLVRAEEGEDPRHAEVVVDHPYLGGGVPGDLELFGEVALNEEQRQEHSLPPARLLRQRGFSGSTAYPASRRVTDSRSRTNSRC